YRYPGARVVGFDVDARAVEVAARRCARQPNVRLCVHDVRQPMVGRVPGAGGFDVAVMWLVLPYLPDRRTVLADLAATVRPGGVVLLGNVPDDALRLDHPGRRRSPGGRPAARRADGVGRAGGQPGIDARRRGFRGGCR